MNIRTLIKIIVPVIIVAVAFGIFKYQMANKPEPKKKNKPESYLLSSLKRQRW